MRKKSGMISCRLFFCMFPAEYCESRRNDNRCRLSLLPIGGVPVRSGVTVDSILINESLVMGLVTPLIG